MKRFGLNTKRLFILLVLLGGAACGAVAGALFALTRDLPQIRALESFRPSAVTRIYSADEVLLAELYLEKRVPVPLAAIPDALKASLIATEDRNFYKHSGVDLKGIARALVRDIRAGRFVEGASTITQQLAKTLFLTPKKNLVRKLKEALLAFQLERRYTKDELLGLYLNQVYFGSGAYGVESAARIFFGKPVGDLNLAECALIAAMPKAPSRYSPLVNKALAEKRRNIVLKQMLDTGIIAPAAYSDAVGTPVVTIQRQAAVAKAPYFTAEIKKRLETELGAALLYKGGLTVHTTLSYKLQQAAEKALADNLRSLEARMARAGAVDPFPQGALFSIDVQTGGILAMVGGRDYARSAYNRATTARRQPGSAFKPILYAHAVEKGFAQNRMILDAPVVFKSARDGEDWRPENFSKNYQGEITLRTALALSKNIPAVRLMELMGPSSVTHFAHALGIRSPLKPNLSLALGTSDVTLAELVAAYAVFANKGRAIRPFGIVDVQDADGRSLFHTRPIKSVAMSKAAAAVITDMLTAVITEGTGKKARALHGSLAGKTGTTDDFRDALFIGFSPSVAAGVWVGLDSGNSLGRGETGAKAALPAWIDFIKAALAEGAYEYFGIPDDVVPVRIDPATGRRAADGVVALFTRDTVPRP